MRLFWWTALGILGVLVLILLIFGRGGRPVKRINITDPQYSSAVLTYTIDGPVVAKENHEAIQISVSSSGRTIEIIQGYEQQPVSTKHFDNTQSAYDAFTQALQSAGFTHQNHNSTSTSIYSVCPQGNRYLYQIENNNAVVYDTWSTSCGDGGVVTFSGSASLVGQLFQAQIPNYSTITQNVQMGSTGSGGLLL